MTVESRQCHRLIADDSLRSVARCRIDTAQAGIRFGAGDEIGRNPFSRSTRINVHVHRKRHDALNLDALGLKDPLAQLLRPRGAHL